MNNLPNDFLKKHKPFFDAAGAVASLSDYYRQKVGCVIVQKNRIISSGHNSNKTHPVQKNYNKFRHLDDSYPHKLHAEVHALIPLLSSDIHGKDLILYVARLRNDQPYGLAKPCDSCMKLIRDLGIEHIYYTTNEGYAHEILRREG